MDAPSLVAPYGGGPFPGFRKPPLQMSGRPSGAMTLGCRIQDRLEFQVSQDGDSLAGKSTALSVCGVQMQTLFRNPLG